VGTGKLTKRAIDAIALPATGEVFVWDGETRGFGLRVASTGTKSSAISPGGAGGSRSAGTVS